MTYEVTSGQTCVLYMLMHSSFFMQQMQRDCPCPTFQCRYLYHDCLQEERLLFALTVNLK